MSREIVVLGIAHAHLILQHLNHRYDALTITIHGNPVNIFGQPIVLTLLDIVSAIVLHIVHRIHILCLHIAECVLIGYLGILQHNLRLTEL